MNLESNPVGIHKVGIVGLGLIGGSLAKAIHGRTDVEAIVGIDPDLKAGELAAQEGVITDFSTDDLRILDGCDLVAPSNAYKSTNVKTCKAFKLSVDFKIGTKYSCIAFLPAVTEIL